MQSTLLAIMAMGGMALFFAAILAFAARYFHIKGDPIVESIESELPQTQCGQCGHPGCAPYAAAVASGESAVNLCVPGGERVMLKLADIMGVDAVAMEQEEIIPAVAFVREDECIGCTLCIRACPVDAIVGAPKQYHTIISDHCTGCELCIAPCPVDCIDMVPKPQTLDVWQWQAPAKKNPSTKQAKQRTEGKNEDV
ncbi:MAG: electron transport complex subunit RsxB [Mariprofundales bacterium]